MEQVTQGLSSIQSKLTKLEQLVTKHELQDFESQTELSVETKHVQTVQPKKQSKSS